MIVEPLPRGLTRRRYQSGWQSLVCLLKPLNGAGSVITFSSDTALATSDRHSLFTSIPSPASAPLQRVQAQIRHKRCPLAPTNVGTSCAFLTGREKCGLRATPIYSVLSLSSPPLRAGRRLYFAFDFSLARSSLTKIENQNGL